MPEPTTQATPATGHTPYPVLTMWQDEREHPWLLLLYAAVAVGSLVFFTLFMPMPARAAEPTAATHTVGLHLGSAHSRPGFEAANPGLYVRSPGGLTLGAYRNSYGRASAYAGHTWQHHFAGGAVGVGLTAGLISGYPTHGRTGLLPLLAPSATLRLSEHTAARLVLVPKPPRPGAAAALHLAVEYRL